MRRPSLSSDGSLCPLAPLLIASLIALASPAPSHAAWILVADFEGGGAGTIPDPTGSSGFMRIISDTNQVAISLGAGTIPDNTIGTLFFEAYIPQSGPAASTPTNVDVSIGLSDLSLPSFANLLSQVLFVGSPTAIQVRNGNGSGAGPTPTILPAASFLGAQKYSFWMVMDLIGNSYDLYAHGPGFAGIQQVASGFGFRRVANPGSVTHLYLLEGGMGNQPMYFDNIYTSAGPNLSNPTPEPTRALLLALASFPLFLTRRRPDR